MARKFDLVIIGGGILGVSLSYFAASLNPGRRIAVIEQGSRVALHASGRNTGKVHAPYLYHPERMSFMARAALRGFGMWEEYARERGLPFKRDGVLHVSLDSAGTRTLEKYMRWGTRNGLGPDDLELVGADRLGAVEPAVRCHSALRVHRDASVDYGSLTDSLMKDSSNAGTAFLLGSRAAGFKERSGWNILLEGGGSVSAKFVVNAAGGASVDVAHGMGAAPALGSMFFMGEYWRAPARYRNLTKTSVYTVPTFPEYPFLDPHWVVRVDGSCEIGPNAVPVFGPYAYGGMENIRQLVPRVLEMIGSGARRTVADGQFQRMALGEIRSSLSRSAMVARVRRFLPGLRAGGFSKGTAGIRSMVVNDRGTPLRGMALVAGRSSLHVLNYNSPGATGALPVAAYIAHELARTGLFRSGRDDAACGPWRFSDVVSDVLSPSAGGIRPAPPRFS